ncbi:methyltransferase [Mycobacterium intermedium]|uniref:methyltransferase n=1 Tax=Mycobacterium intermedium TaxID=28445 RepID=UPI0027E28375|nr:methyltransferase [Mycobacterium intermedium]
MKLVDRLRYNLYRLHQRLVPPPAAMVELILAGWTSQAIEAAAELGVADALVAGPMQPDDLAAKIGADPDAPSRLLRALCSRGVFRRRTDGSYALTPLAATLRTDAAGSMNAAARYYGSPQHREHWSMLAESVRTGRASIPRLRGKEFFAYLEDDPYLAELFNGAMTSISEMAELPVVAAYDFTPYRMIMDVGGGHGRLLAAILTAVPAARGVLFEIPDVVPGAQSLLRKLGVAERIQIETGSFFDGVPAGADLYFLKHIIHDWPDDQAVTILRNVRAAGGADARVVLAELVIPDHDRDFVGKWADLEMLLGLDGSRERTEDEYGTLLATAGFKMTRVIPTASPYSLIEARAA